MNSLTERQRDLLKDLLAEKQEQPTGVNALRFRVKHEEHRSDLDILERNKVIERKDNKYRLNLLALAELQGQSREADHVVLLCEKVFKILRAIYRSDLERQIPIIELASRAELSESDVCVALAYLFSFPIWRSYTLDLNVANAYVVPSEDVLDYKTFEDVINQLRRWSSRSARIGSDQTREKHQKFGILDSPVLLASDLETACGSLGRAVLYIDLDDFKRLNTAFTEVVVDQIVLPPIHRMLRASIDRLGYVYGEGGDEVTMYLPNASLPMALDFAEAVRQRIEETTFEGLAAPMRVTASIGIAHTSREDDGAKLRERANLAKNYAKGHGRNCIAIRTQIGLHVIQTTELDRQLKESLLGKRTTTTEADREKPATNLNLQLPTIQAAEKRTKRYAIPADVKDIKLSSATNKELGSLAVAIANDINKLLQSSRYDTPESELIALFNKRLAFHFFWVYEEARNRGHRDTDLDRYFENPASITNVRHLAQQLKAVGSRLPLYADN